MLLWHWLLAYSVSIFGSRGNRTHVLAIVLTAAASTNLPTLVTRFVQYFATLHNFEYLWQILRVYLVFGRILNLLWQKCCAIWQIFIALNGQKFAIQDVSFQPESLASIPRSWSLLEKSWKTSLLSKSAAKLPLTIFGDMALFGPMLASKRLVPKCGFFSLISEEKMKIRNWSNWIFGMLQWLLKVIKIILISHLENDPCFLAWKIVTVLYL